MPLGEALNVVPWWWALHDANILFDVSHAGLHIVYAQYRIIVKFQTLMWQTNVWLWGGEQPLQPPRRSWAARLQGLTADLLQYN